MSSSLENFHYVVYNEFESPTQFMEPSQNFFGLKNIIQSASQELDSPHKNGQGENSNNARQLIENCTVQASLTELADLIDAATSKQTRDGNVNVFNKCVFFVNSYNGSNDHQDANRILNQLSNRIAKPLTPTHNSETGEELTQTVPHCLDGSEYAKLENLYEQIESIQSDNTPDVSITSPIFEDEAIVVSSDSESETVHKSEYDNKLFFVDRHDLKPILTPNVIPGIYRKVSPVKDILSKVRKPNVFRGTKERNGIILSAKDFEASYVTDCDVAIRTEEVTDIGQTCELQNIPKVTLPSSAREPAINFSSKDTNDSLQQLAYDILKLPIRSNCVKFNRSKNELIYRDPTTNKKIIYRIVQPSELDLDRANIIRTPLLGNPTFVQILDVRKCNIPANTNIPVQGPKRPRGRPRKPPRKKPSISDELKVNNLTLNNPPNLHRPKPALASTSPPRSRCGRLSKLPTFIESNFKVSTELLQLPAFGCASDKDFQCNAEISPPLLAETLEESTAKRERNVPPEYRCNGCNKIYLGKSKMLKHFGAFPDHFTNPGVEEMIKDTTLYTFLVKKVQQPNLTEDQRITLLLNELTDFVSQLQARRSQLVTHKSAIYFVNSIVSKVIGAPEGHYGVDLRALSAPPPPPGESTLLDPPPPRLDYNLSISLDDTIADAKLNLSENMMASDDSLLRTVDDLVKEGIKNLTGEDVIPRNPVINYDHASDNAVEAVNMKETQPPPMLDLSLDLFQFNSN